MNHSPESQDCSPDDAVFNRLKLDNIDSDAPIVDATDRFLGSKIQLPGRNTGQRAKVSTMVSQLIQLMNIPC